jgi:NCS1 family nucleobase:cation symporter-1
VSWWVSAWTSFGRLIGFTAQSWMSASILSFAVAALITLLAGWLAGLAKRLRGEKAACVQEIQQH